jgi:hypothetical protein
MALYSMRSLEETNPVDGYLTVEGALRAMLNCSVMTDLVTAHFASATVGVDLAVL